MTHMTRILAAAAALSPAWLAAQQPGWMSTRGSDPITVWMNAPQAQSGPVAGKPFSATEVRRTVQVLADGSRLDQSETSSFARDERGRMRTATANTVLIFDPVAGFTYTLDLPSKTYSKTPLSGPEATYSIAVLGNHTATSVITGGGVSKIRAAASDTATGEELASQFLNGILAKGSRVTTTIPAGALGNNRDLKVVNERWYSDDMQILLKSSNSDPRFGATTYELTHLDQRSPDSSLFQVPPDFRLRAAHSQE